ncbi:MAG: hypothetical protein KAT15_13835 [Bacteroidales bacterium]|nr:hypothetical protein [Bacteroidales bacterium]
MENHYLCPHCRGHLRVGEYIVFKIRNRKKEKGLLLLHPEVGNYTSIKHPHFQFEEGERIDFFCPLCLQFLDAALDENLVHVIMIDKQRNEHEIYFSRIAGEKSTYQVSEGGVMETGEHSHRYTHFKMSDDFIQYLQS